MADLWAVHIDEQKKVVFVQDKPFLMLHHRAWANKKGQLTSSVFARAERLSATSLYLQPACIWDLSATSLYLEPFSSQPVSGTFLQPACIWDLSATSLYLGPFRLKAFLKAWTILENSPVCVLSLVLTV